METQQSHTIEEIDISKIEEIDISKIKDEINSFKDLDDFLNIVEKLKINIHKTSDIIVDSILKMISKKFPTPKVFDFFTKNSLRDSLKEIIFEILNKLKIKNHKININISSILNILIDETYFQNNDFDNKTPSLENFKLLSKAFLNVYLSIIQKIIHINQNALSKNSSINILFEETFNYLKKTKKRIDGTLYSSEIIETKEDDKSFKKLFDIINPTRSLTNLFNNTTSIENTKQNKKCPLQQINPYDKECKKYAESIQKTQEIFNKLTTHQVQVFIHCLEYKIPLKYTAYKLGINIESCIDFLTNLKITIESQNYKPNFQKDLNKSFSDYLKEYQNHISCEDININYDQNVISAVETMLNSYEKEYEELLIPIDVLNMGITEHDLSLPGRAKKPIRLSSHTPEKIITKIFKTIFEKDRLRDDSFKGLIASIFSTKDSFTKSERKRTLSIFENINFDILTNNELKNRLILKQDIKKYLEKDYIVYLGIYVPISNIKHLFNIKNCEPLIPTKQDDEEKLKENTIELLFKHYQLSENYKEKTDLDQFNTTSNECPTIIKQPTNSEKLTKNNLTDVITLLENKKNLIKSAIQDIMFLPSYPIFDQNNKSKEYLNEYSHETSLFIENLLSRHGINNKINGFKNENNAFHRLVFGGRRLTKSISHEYRFAFDISYHESRINNDIVYITGAGTRNMIAPFAAQYKLYEEKKKQNIKDELDPPKSTGFTVNGLVDLEPPNKFINSLVILPDFEKREEGEIRSTHGVRIHPGGHGTIQEILTTFAVKINNIGKNDSMDHYIIDFVEPKSSKYFDFILEQFHILLGKEIENLYSRYLVKNPISYAKATKEKIEKIPEKYLKLKYNKDIEFPVQFQIPLNTLLDSLITPDTTNTVHNLQSFFNKNLDLSLQQDKVSLLSNMVLFFYYNIYATIIRPDIFYPRENTMNTKPMIQGHTKIIKALDRIIDYTANEGRVVPIENRYFDDNKKFIKPYRTK